MEFSFERWSNGFRIRKRYVRTGLPAHDISGPYWMLILIASRGGTFRFLSGGAPVAAGEKEIALYLPPYSWSTDISARGLEVAIDGLISATPPPSARFSVPTIFAYSGPTPSTRAEVGALLKAAAAPVPVPVASRPRAVTKRLKTLIDDDSHGGQRPSDGANVRSLGDMALELGSSQAALTRAFKSDFGFPPVEYRRGLRITIGMYALMDGKPIVEAAANAGFQDLSRFNKQFRQYLTQSPKEYKRR